LATSRAGTTRSLEDAEGFGPWGKIFSPVGISKDLLRIWVVATPIFLEFSPQKLGKMIPILTSIFFKGVETAN